MYKSQQITAAFSVGACILTGCAASSDSSPVAQDDVTTAKVVTFDCSTDKVMPASKVKERAQFALTNISDPKKVDFKYRDKKSEEEGIVLHATPEEGSMVVLNENYSINVTKDRLELGGDGDGFELVDLVLYKNTDYKTGYFRSDNRAGGPSGYSTVTCKVSGLAPASSAGNKKASGEKCLVNAECASGTCIKGIAEYKCK